MQCLGFAVALGLLFGTWAQINVVHPECDSPEAEGAALVAQDYLNAQHSHGYKYALNRIEDIKIITKPDGDLYVMDIELLQTDCHVFDPTPISNCTVRPKALTAVEGDCDVVVKNISGALTVTAFKCNTEESREDICLGCPTLLPLNDTKALDFVQVSLGTFNNMTENVTFSLLEVGRMSSQNVLGGPIYLAEYIVTEANCTGYVCEPLNDAVRGICSAKGVNSDHSIDCKMYPNLISEVDNTSLVTPVVHAHSGNHTTVHGLRHHKLRALHDPFTLLSAESAESAESVEAVPAVAPAPSAAPAQSATPAPSAAPAQSATPAPSAAPAQSATPAPSAAPAQSATPTPSAAPAPFTDLPQAEVAADSPNSQQFPWPNFKRDLTAVNANSPVAHDSPVLLVSVCPGRIRFFD